MTQKKLTVKEFREQGYLQELNRQFLHPLGLALEVVVEEDGTEHFGEVWDSRDDPEGIIYGQLSMMDPARGTRILDEQIAKRHARLARFGWYIQPLP